MRRMCVSLAAPLLFAFALWPAQNVAAQPVVRPTGEAQRLDSLGALQWVEYERLAHRARSWAERDVSLVTTPRGSPKIFDPELLALSEERFSTLPRHRQAMALRRNSAPYDPPLGRSAYLAAMQHFRDAQRIDSTNSIITRHVFRALAAENEWPALLAEAQRAVRRRNDDTDAWLAQALALHRQERYTLASAAFDSALKRMPDTRRAPFQSVTRLLVPNQYANGQRLPDSLQYVALPAAEQARISQRYWERNDPRPSTSVNEAKLEYLARLTYADIRWSSDGGARGIDTDRGDIHVRFGPPEGIYGSSRGQIWTYRDGALFYFGHGPSYLANLIASSERRLVEDSILISQPSGWTEMPLVRNTWPMLMRVARFRASTDSADAVVTAAVPVRSLVGDAQLGGQLPIDVHLDVHTPDVGITGAEQRRVTVERTQLPVSFNGTWVRRLGMGSSLVRIDAEQPDVGRGAVSSADVAVDSLAGFGVSDILFGTMTPDASSASPLRWSEVAIAPTIGLFQESQPMGVVWETYDLTPKDGAVAYTVTLSLERTFKKSLAGFSARIARNLVNVVTQTGSATGQIDVSFNESRPASPVVTNALTVDLAGSITGPYRLRIEVKDLNSGRVTRRTADFQLVPN